MKIETVFYCVKMWKKQHKQSKNKLFYDIMK